MLAWVKTNALNARPSSSVSLRPGGAADCPGGAIAKRRAAAPYHLPMQPEFWTYAFLCVSAFFAGAMNSIAGGGTLLTFPALTAHVLPAIANGTSTVALLPGPFAGAF